ncbi:MAG TPA: pyrroline-5-carboxylate reductase [Pseudomonadales bacterium]
MNTTKIAFIGAGNMAAALVEGLISKGLNAEQVIMSDPSKDRLAYVEKTFGVKTCSNNRTAADQADVIMLAVKPQIMSAILDDLKPAVADRSKVIISIAAGITLARLAKSLGNETALVRCMPNTPALVQTGATGMFANEHVSSAQKALAEQILQAVGIVVWLEQEQQLDAVTALSGSGPAYYFLVMEAMIAAGEAMGLTPDTAKQLTLQTALGAAKMAGTGDVDPAELRRRVTSPGGTTEAAIHSLEKNQLVGIFGQALAAAKRRSEELGQQG